MDVDYQIAKLITEPRLYENFVKEFKMLKEQKQLNKALYQNAQRKGSVHVDHVSRNVKIVKNLQNYQVQKVEQLKRAQRNFNEVKSRRMVQEGEVQKLRMLQVAKWDIVRAKEKEMLTKLGDLKTKQKNMEKCITHIVLHQMLVRLYTNTSELLEKKRIETKRRMGCILIYIALKA